MKFFIRNFLIGGVIGIIGAVLILTIADGITINQFVIFYSLVVIIAILIIISMIFMFQIKSAMKEDVSGDEQDELDRTLYIKSSDMLMISNIIVFLSIVLISMTIIKSFPLAYIVSAILLTFVSIALQYYQLSQYKKMYPERKMPSANDPEYTDKLIDIADEGERFVILQGMMKAFNMFTTLLLLAIIFSTFYSMFSDHQQIFSIVLMGVILIISHCVYYVTIRKKA